MPTPLVPFEVAQAKGRTKVNPARFKNRKPPEQTDPLGAPYDWIVGDERTAWRLFQQELPWLRESHRPLVEVASKLRARLMGGEMPGVQALNLYRQCLGQMGATPADESKVRGTGGGESDDPADQFFN